MEAAVTDDEFIALLRATLRAWGIGVRGSKMVDERAFATGLAEEVAALHELEALSIEAEDLDSSMTASMVYGLITTLPIVTTRAKVVAGTKTLHHLLPNLVPPIDRAWTGEFFGWNKTADFQNAQERIFVEGFTTLAAIAQQTKPSRLVGPGWRTSPSKILDNALIGWCTQNAPQPGADPNQRPMS